MDPDPKMEGQTNRDMGLKGDEIEVPNMPYSGPEFPIRFLGFGGARLILSSSCSSQLVPGAAADPAQRRAFSEEATLELILLHALFLSFSPFYHRLRQHGVQILGQCEYSYHFPAFNASSLLCFVRWCWGSEFTFFWKERGLGRSFYVTRAENVGWLY